MGYSFPVLGRYATPRLNWPARIAGLFFQPHKTWFARKLKSYITHHDAYVPFSHVILVPQGSKLQLGVPLNG